MYYNEAVHFPIQTLLTRILQSLLLLAFSGLSAFIVTALEPIVFFGTGGYDYIPSFVVFFLAWVAMMASLVGTIAFLACSVINLFKPLVPSDK